MISETDVLDVREPPGKAMGKVAELWKPIEGTNKILCTACARYCKIGEGQVGLCGIRGVHEGKLWLYVYGRVITGHVDPIEKKPVSHYRPGSKIFSIATTGCNWLCHPAGTPILLHDGSTKPVEEIRPGDTLRSLADRIGLQAPAIVTASGRRKAVSYRISVAGHREALLATAEHPVLTTRGWIEASCLRPGDSLLIAQRESIGLAIPGRISVPAHGTAFHPGEMARFWRLWSGETGSGPGFRWSSVLRVNRESAPEPVYSFECVPFHNYVANGIVVHNCRYCFLPGTLVMTERGFRAIDAIFKEGQPTEDPEIRFVGWMSALTHRDRWRIVKKAFEHLFSGQVLEIRVRGLPPLRCTPDHPIFAAGQDSALRKVRADRLKVGDFLAVPRTVMGTRKPIVESDMTSADRIGAATLMAAESLEVTQELDEYALVPIADIRETTYIGPVYNIEVEEDHSYTANLLAVANCQNADISQRRKVEGIEVEPQDVVRMTLEQGCQGLAYTYNQPTIFIEFARDIGMLARKAGLINIFVSNGYDTPETVAEMPKFLDCVTVDFKGSGETNFVRKYINIPNADPIFQTLLDTRDTKKIHIEITDLIVPQVGDDLVAARHLSKWVYDNLGPDTPIHFLRFHPDYKMMEFPWTPVETLESHCTVAKEEGLKYVYIGNVPGHPLENTYCPGCGAVAIKRYGFDITGWYLDKDNKCKKCGYALAIFGRLERTAKENRFYSVLYHR
jgi:pyruvate formate lyase activating enzyme